MGQAWSPYLASLCHLAQQPHVAVPCAALHALGVCPCETPGQPVVPIGQRPDRRAVVLQRAGDLDLPVGMAQEFDRACLGGFNRSSQHQVKLPILDTH